jgi:hypothetical protein
MKILLDENIPLVLVERLRDEGRDVEHIILLGIRGTLDSVIRKRLDSEKAAVSHLCQDFFGPPVTHSVIMISRVAQSGPIAMRLDAWLNAIREYFSRPWSEKLFEVFDDGKLHPWTELSYEN